MPAGLLFVGLLPTGLLPTGLQTCCPGSLLPAPAVLRRNHVSRSTRYLFFDTETSGLPRQMDAPVARLENWPRVVQLAWILTDFQGRVISQRQYLIQPTGWRMQPGALRVHGITLAHARRHGHPLPDVLHRFALDLLQTDSIIGHNVQFDQKILGAEFLRLGQTNPLQRRHAQCTMKMGAVFLQRWSQLPQGAQVASVTGSVATDPATAVNSYSTTDSVSTGPSHTGFSNSGSPAPAPADSGLLEVATSVETDDVSQSASVSQSDGALLANSVSEAAAAYRIDSAQVNDSHLDAAPKSTFDAHASGSKGVTTVQAMSSGGAAAPRPAVEGATWRDSGSGFRYPSLRRLHRTLFGYEFDNAHDALADTQACLNCFFRMCRDTLS